MFFFGCIGKGHGVKFPFKFWGPGPKLEMRGSARPGPPPGGPPIFPATHGGPRPGPPPPGPNSKTPPFLTLERKGKGAKNSGKISPRGDKPPFWGFGGEFNLVLAAGGAVGHSGGWWDNPIRGQNLGQRWRPPRWGQAGF